MPEIRQNLATREWVIIATERAKRPEQFALPHREHTAIPPYDDRCPFCPGNEELDLERLRLPAEGPWQQRVVRNRYPALQEDSDGERQLDGIHRSIPGVGYHEVVVESRLHNTNPALETVDEVEGTLRAFQLRSWAYGEDERVEQVICFKNHGPTAGTSLLHPHAQIIALPVVPYTVRARAAEARRYFDDHGECVICRMRTDEEASGERLVAETQHFSAFVPYAAFSPFHLWIVPRRHAASFGGTTPEELRDLAALLRDILRRIYFALNDPDYNYVIRTAPQCEHTARHLHWYLPIIPRVSHSAGFELGSGMFINTALPEESARFLREFRIT
ncbi:MAG TPA: galactose-1-phosphate uridylyltransferase [Roseiflexaceae bacterium]|nr:galactose-1-phosphate uridylyltransferase [Roseiflexaceae bacterium]